MSSQDEWKQPVNMGINQTKTLAEIIEEGRLKAEKLHKAQLPKMRMLFPWDSHELPEKFIGYGVFHKTQEYRLQNNVIPADHYLKNSDKKQWPSLRNSDDK